MYDFLIVGAGLSAAAFCASVKSKYKICVMDIRPHIGGNCYDYKSGNIYNQLYGPHFFHTTNTKVKEVASKYTEWIEYTHSVTAEVIFKGNKKKVPFPYSKETEKALGASLTVEERIDLFFKPYSKKMWNLEWEDIPESIKKRVPQDTDEKSIYFPNQFTAIPKFGYTKMIENMFDGVDFILGCGEDDWKKIQAHNVIYCGRPDHLIDDGPFLEWRNLMFIPSLEEWTDSTTVVNFCRLDNPFTRKTSQGKIWKTDNKLVIYEKPMPCDNSDKNPYYPLATPGNLERFKWIEEQIKSRYPNLRLLGRMAEFLYIDMDNAIARGMKLAKEFI